MDFLLAINMVVQAAAVAAQDNPWVDQLRNPSGHLCCSSNDGRRLDDPEWRTIGDGYEVLFTEGWVRIPDWAIVQDRNQDGVARVWSVVGPDGRSIRCFIPGAFG